VVDAERQVVDTHGRLLPEKGCARKGLTTILPSGRHIRKRASGAAWRRRATEDRGQRTEKRPSLVLCASVLCLSVLCPLSSKAPLTRAVLHLPVGRVARPAGALDLLVDGQGAGLVLLLGGGVQGLGVLGIGLGLLRPGGLVALGRVV